MWFNFKKGAGGEVELWQIEAELPKGDSLGQNGERGQKIIQM